MVDSVACRLYYRGVVQAQRISTRLFLTALKLSMRETPEFRAIECPYQPEGEVVQYRKWQV
jgi:hypothetical protein